MIQKLVWRHSRLDILDQRFLPAKTVFVRAATPDQTAKAIKDMVTRGAPLIGCVAAYGYALALRAKTPPDWARARHTLDAAASTLKAARPTAVALAYAVDRLHGKALDYMAAHSDFTNRSLAGLTELLDQEAQAVFDEDVRANERLSATGAKLLKKRSTVITVCNAGTLATAGIGTALGVIYKAFEQGKIERVYSLETRPYLQGARLTMYELMHNKVPASLITDNMAAHIMATSEISAVIAGADRIASNGDTANKIGTYMLAVLARYHKIPFYIAAPVPTIDPAMKTGADIPIEERASCEVCRFNGLRIAPEGAQARHPAFDVTPARLITAIITENGLISPVNRKNTMKAYNKGVAL
ncbi:MAG: S-methyl-5-thioribose-1-phosphate isomerase [Elusimicrobiaceae bacterium]|nr:S-methyl-5-thioribose-1-phosphate isomerase [Elusimicrobiaceae bacterium]